MAKRKAARPRRASKAPARGTKSRSARRKTAARKPAARKRLARKVGRKKVAAKKTAASARKAKAKVATRKAARSGAKRVTRRAGASASAIGRKRSAAATKRATSSPKPAARSSAAPPKATRARSAPKRKLVPSLNRERRAVTDTDEFVVAPPSSPPSSLNLDRTASAARSGRRELKERYEAHNETSPALTAGDVDADWESAYAVGDEAPGGDNPTPDQDIVDDIGRAVGVEYQDNEELKGEKKILERDKHRWELDPASSEDYEDR